MLSLLNRLIQRLDANPVAHVELQHQWNVMEKSRSGRVWILLALVLLLPALSATLMFFGAALLGYRMPVPVLFSEIRSLSQSLETAGQLTMMTMNIAQYLVVMLVAYGLSNNSINREKRGKTWENLLLTDISARKIVIGKWWASLRALYGDHIVVGLLRLGMLVYLLDAFGRFILTPPPTGVMPESFILPAGQLLILGLFVLLFTAIDTGMNTAMGLTVALMDVPGAVGLLIFGLMRAVATFLGVWFIINTINLVWYRGDALYVVYASAFLISYGLLTWGMLRLAQIAAVVGSNASPSLTASTADA